MYFGMTPQSSLCPEEGGSKLLRNVGYCTPLHGIRYQKTHVIIIIITAVRSSISEGSGHPIVTPVQIVLRFILPMTYSVYVLGSDDSVLVHPCSRGLNWWYIRGNIKMQLLSQNPANSREQNLCKELEGSLLYLQQPAHLSLSGATLI